jgi:hypothetical protein
MYRRPCVVLTSWVKRTPLPAIPVLPRLPDGRWDGQLGPKLVGRHSWVGCRRSVGARDGGSARLRSSVADLVHGNDWEVSDQQLQQVELLARVLLTARLLGAVPDVVRQEFLSAGGISSQSPESWTQST